MTIKRDVDLHKYDIDSDKYRELFYFCKQYESRKEEIDSLRGLSAVVNDGMPRGYKIGDQTANKAIKIEKLQKDNELIEQAAVQTDPYVYQFLLKNVTSGISYEYMDVPCGRRQFYEKRRLFFKILSEKR